MKKRALFSLLITFLLTLPISLASAATYYYVHGTSSLNVREQAGTGAAVKTSVPRDLAVISYKKANTDWAYVQFSDGTQGYVMRKYLKSSTTSIAYIGSDDVILRTVPSSSASESSILKHGTRVKVLTGGFFWSYISADTGTGYVQKSVLSSSSVQTADTNYTAYVINSSGRAVNVRSGAGKKFTVLGELPPGSKVTVEKAEGKWSKVSGSLSGWIMSQYLSKARQGSATMAISESGESSSSQNQRYIVSPNSGKVNVRYGPGETEYDVAAQLEPGTKVTFLSSLNDWSVIRYNGQSVYVKSEFLSAKKPDSSVSDNGHAFTPFTGIIFVGEGRTVFLRENTGQEYAAVAQISSGEKARVVGEKNSWYIINYNGLTGYIMKEYVRTE